MSLEKQKARLIDRLKAHGYLKTVAVEAAMRRVPREAFLPASKRTQAYDDHPLSIACKQTCSAPHMCAMMCELLELRPGLEMLEVGTGSGYHAALCAELVAPEGSASPGHVYTLERHEDLAQAAQATLNQLGYGGRVTVVCTDGTRGYPPEAPYDRVLVTAAAPDVPAPLIEQLGDGGRICIPVGGRGYSQELVIVHKADGRVRRERVCGVAFVPLLGEHGFKP